MDHLSSTMYYSQDDDGMVAIHQVGQSVNVNTQAFSLLPCLTRDELAAQCIKPHYRGAAIGHFVRYLDVDDNTSYSGSISNNSSVDDIIGRSGTMMLDGTPGGGKDPLSSIIRSSDLAGKQKSASDSRPKVYRVGRIVDVAFCKPQHMYLLGGDMCDVMLTLDPAPAGDREVQLQRVSNQRITLAEFEQYMERRFPLSRYWDDAKQRAQAAAATKKQQQEEQVQRAAAEQKEKRKLEEKKSANNEGSSQPKEDDDNNSDLGRSGGDDDDDDMAILCGAKNNGDDAGESEKEKSAAAAAVADASMAPTIRQQSATEPDPAFSTTILAEARRDCEKAKTAVRAEIVADAPRIAGNWRNGAVNYILNNNDDQRHLMERTEKLQRARHNLAGDIKATINQLELKLEGILDKLGSLNRAAAEAQRAAEAADDERRRVRRAEREKAAKESGKQPLSELEHDAAEEELQEQQQQQQQQSGFASRNPNQERDADEKALAELARERGEESDEDDAFFGIDDPAFKELTVEYGSLFGTDKRDGDDPFSPAAGSPGSSAARKRRQITSSGGSTWTRERTEDERSAELEVRHAQKQARKLYVRLKQANERFSECIKASSVRGGIKNRGSGGLAFLTQVNRERNNLLMLRGEKLRALRDAGSKPAAVVDDNIWTLDAAERGELADQFILDLAAGDKEDAAKADKPKQKPAEVVEKERAERILERTKTQVAGAIERQHSQSTQFSTQSPTANRTLTVGGNNNSQRAQDDDLLFGGDDLFADLVRSATQQKQKAVAAAANGGAELTQQQRRQSSSSQLFSYPRRRERDAGDSGSMKVASSSSSGELPAPFNSAVSF